MPNVCLYTHRQSLIYPQNHAVCFYSFLLLVSITALSVPAEEETFITSRFRTLDQAEIQNLDTKSVIQMGPSLFIPHGRICFSSEGKSVLISAGLEYRCLQLLNLEKGTIEYTFDSESKEVPIMNYALSPQGDRVFIALLKSCKIWIKTQNQDIRLKYQPVKDSSITASNFSLDGKLLVFSERVFSPTEPMSVFPVYFYNVETGERIKALQHKVLESGPVEIIEFSPDGKYLLTASHEGIVRIWDIESSKEIGMFLHSRIKAAKFTPSGKYLLTVGELEPVVKSWKVETCTLFRSYIYLSSWENNNTKIQMQDICISPDGNWFLTRDQRQRLYLWEVATESPERLVDRMKWCFLDRYLVLLGGAFVADGKSVIGLTQDGKIPVWRLGSGDLVRVIEEDISVRDPLFPRLVNDKKSEPNPESPTEVPLLYRKLAGIVEAQDEDWFNIIETMGKNFELHIRLDNWVDHKVSYRLENPTVKQVLESVLPQAGLDYVALGRNSVRIGKDSIIQKYKAKPDLSKPVLQKTISKQKIIENQPLAEVVQFLEQETGVKFQLRDCLDKKVSFGVIIEVTLQNILDQMLLYYDLQYAVTDKEEILIEPVKEK